jgi:hypothetical protein
MIAKLTGKTSRVEITRTGSRTTMVQHYTAGKRHGQTDELESLKHKTPERAESHAHKLITDTLALGGFQLAA